MTEFLEALNLHWALPYAALLATCVALLWWALIADKGDKAKLDLGLTADESGKAELNLGIKREIAIEEFPDLHVPRELHAEIAMEPPSGLRHSNPSKPYSFQNDCCSGSYIFFHRPTGAPGVGNQECQGMNFADYFEGKSRLWELRLHFRFRAAFLPEESLHFGLELESYVPLNCASRRFASLAVAAVRQAIGPVYHSVGDDPSKTVGEVERPTCVLPLWAFDQFIETPDGEEPPSLTDPKFSQLGSRRFKRVAAFQKEINELQERIRPGCTYTFAFWGNSRFLDVLNWKLVGLPMVPPLDFDRFAGRPPVHCVLYSLMPKGDGPLTDTRHVQSRKKYIFHAAIWTSTRRPERERFEELIGTEQCRSSHGCEGGKKRKSLQGQVSSFFMNQIQCCTARTRAALA